MELLDSIPPNWFVLITSVLTGIILFLIIFKIPDEPDEKEKKKPKKS